MCLPVFSAAAADGAYTITAAAGADVTSDAYLDIWKYLAYYDGGDILSIPAGCITVGQWKANIANPSINANGLADGDYITDRCTLTLTYDDASTKTVRFEVNDYNYVHASFDKTKEPAVSSTYKLNTALQLTSGGGAGTITPASELLSDGNYAMTVSITDQNTEANAAATNRYFQAVQSLAAINEAITTPYIVNMEVAFEDESLSSVAIALMKGSSQRAPRTLSGSALLSKFKSGAPVWLALHVFPKANRMDIYVDGEAVVKNHNLVTSDSTYADCNNLFVRAYNNTKVDGAYQDAKMRITDYSVYYGYGSALSEIYTPTVVEILNYDDETVVKPSALEPLEVSVNKDGYQKAALYVDGYKEAEADVSGRSAVLPADAIGLGRHTVEVRLYPEYGKYVSREISVEVSDSVELDGYLVDFENFEAGESPQEYTLGTGIKADFLHLQYEAVESYDTVRNNVLHVRAETATTGTARFEYITNTAVDCRFSFDFRFDDFVESSLTIVETVQNANAAAGLERTIAACVQTRDGALLFNSAVFAELETERWYTLAFDYFNSNNILNIYLYDDAGNLLSSVSGTSPGGQKAVNTLRIYTPYVTETADRSGDFYLDNVCVIPVSYTGGITGVSALLANPYTVTADVSNTSAVAGVAVTNELGDVAVLQEFFDASAGKLDITLGQPLVAGMRYKLTVYDEAGLYPMTYSFVPEGAYLFVEEFYFKQEAGKNYVVLNVSNTYPEAQELKLLISCPEQMKAGAVRAVSLTADPGVKDYAVEITEDLSTVRILPVQSYAKPVAVSGSVITK